MITSNINLTSVQETQTNRLKDVFQYKWLYNDKICNKVLFDATLQTLFFASQFSARVISEIFIFNYRKLGTWKWKTTNSCWVLRSSHAMLMLPASVRVISCTSGFSPLLDPSPLTCMSLQSAQPRTRPGRGHTLSGRAPDAAAPPACAPPRGSARPGPQTRSSAQGSCSSWVQLWPQCFPRRRKLWASYWCHTGLPLSICLLCLLRFRHGWQTLLSPVRRSRLMKIVPLFCLVLPATSTLGKQQCLSKEPNNKAVLF